MLYNLAQITSFHKAAAKQHLLETGDCPPSVWLYLRSMEIMPVSIELTDDIEQAKLVYRTLRLLAVANDAVAIVHRVATTVPTGRGEVLLLAVAAHDDDGGTIRRLLLAPIARRKDGSVRRIGAWENLDIEITENRVHGILPPADLPEADRARARDSLAQYVTPNAASTSHAIH